MKVDAESNVTILLSDGNEVSDPFRISHRENYVDIEHLIELFSNKCIKFGINMALSLSDRYNSFLKGNGMLNDTWIKTT